MSSYLFIEGKVSERSKERGWKPRVVKAAEGSNPSFSAILEADNAIFCDKLIFCFHLKNVGC